jgi:regulator of sirC expression with transglutaminase-like and TPR domain
MLPEIVEKIRHQFAEIASKPGEIDLAKAALLIAKIAYPRLDEQQYTGRLEQMGDLLKSRTETFGTPEAILGEFNRLLFENEGFRGNREAYYDPDNSFLNKVMDRKLGIPISLAVVCIEVGRRSGMDIRGISLPGHFIIGYFHQEKTYYLDPFNRGILLEENDCRNEMMIRYGNRISFSPKYLQSVGPRRILTRMLRNLKAIYLNLGHDIHAFEMIHWILTLDPGSPDELLERGYLYERMGNPDGAVKDLTRWAEQFPESANTEKIWKKIKQLRHQPSRLH